MAKNTGKVREFCQSGKVGTLIDRQQLQSFFGMVTYMGNYVSHHMEPLRAMLKKEAIFHWDK